MTLLAQKSLHGWLSVAYAGAVAVASLVVGGNYAALRRRQQDDPARRERQLGN